ncbi:hypothetical protein IR009_12415 [Pseudomonas putida]|uniref:hypothetical protein n=1 Tax=Pseudomonas putida TaxID=303 RepID=UPI0018A89CCE|nr:hypothetical protein [Pseudomonas putida]MBF8766027.1 hypothetical protein [Pseudomonas putida]
MSDDRATVEGLKALVGQIHKIRQRENIRFRINLLQARGLTDAQVLKALKSSPPVVELDLSHL